MSRTLSLFSLIACELRANNQLLNEGVTSLVCACNNEKHCKNQLQSISHCGSFDHLDMQSLNIWGFKIDCDFVSHNFLLVMVGCHIVCCWLLYMVLMSIIFAL